MTQHCSAPPDAGTTGASSARATSGPSPRLIIGLLFIVSVLNYVDRQVPFILIEAIKADLNLSDTQMGLLTGFTFSVVYSTLAIPVAMLADRWSAKWILSGGMLLWCSLTALAGAAQSFGQLIFTRMGVAAGEAASLPASHALISSVLPPEKRGVAISLVSLGVPFGAMVGLTLGGLLNDLGNWRMAMIVIGVPGILFSLVFMALVPNVRAASSSRTAGSGTADRPFAGLKHLLALPSFRHLTAGLAIQAIGQTAIYAFSAAFIIRSHGFSASEAGLGLGIANGISGIIALLLSGWATDRIARRGKSATLLLPAAAFAVMGPLIVAGYLVNDAILALVLLGGVNLCAVFYMPPAFAAAQRLALPQMRAQASALPVVGVSLIGGSIGPFLAGMVSDALEPLYGRDALRYSLCLASVPALWGAIHLFLANRKLDRDVEYVDALPGGAS